jgi:hypothetical protein
VESDDERKAENEAIFRDANERIEAVRNELSEFEGKTPFFCECGDAGCREIIRLELVEYEAVRANPAAFVLARGHADSDGRVVAEQDGYLIVEKEGAARRVAVETDPRSDDG